MKPWVHINKPLFLFLCSVLRAVYKKKWFDFTLPQLGVHLGINPNSFRQYCSSREDSVSFDVLYYLEEVFEAQLENVNIDNIIVVKIKLWQPAGWLSRPADTEVKLR